MTDDNGIVVANQFQKRLIIGTPIRYTRHGNEVTINFLSPDCQEPLVMDIACEYIGTKLTLRQISLVKELCELENDLGFFIGSDVDEEKLEDRRNRITEIHEELGL